MRDRKLEKGEVEERKHVVVVDWVWQPQLYIYFINIFIIKNNLASRIAYKSLEPVL